MGEIDSDLQLLLRTCRELDTLPPPRTDANTQSFFSNFTLERLFRTLAHARNKDDVVLISDVLGKLLGTELGRSLLPGALPYLEAATAAPLPSLRRLAAEQYGNLLLANVRQSAQTGDGTATDGGLAGTSCRQLIRILTADPDTGVAAAAAAALRAYGASGAAALRHLLAPGSTVAAALAAAAVDDRSGTVRLRVLSLALELAAGGCGSVGTGRRLANGHQPHHQPAGAADAFGSGAGLDLDFGLDERLSLLRGSGLLDSLLTQLADPRDPLAALAALQLLEELLTAADADGGDGGGGASGLAAALAGVALPQLLALVAEPTLTEAAMPLVAGIVRRCMPAILPAAAVATAVAANGANGPVAMEEDSIASSASPSAAAAELPPALRAAPALLAAVRGVLDDRGDAGPAAEAAGLDAVGVLAQSRAGAQMVLADVELTRALCERALGRSPHPEVRTAALHALAGLAGLEAAGGQRSRAAARLPRQCEECLRHGVFGCAGGVRRPGEVLLGLLQQPFGDVRVAAYRAIAALALRSWFAVELVTCAGLLDRLTSPGEEAGAAAANWRHAALAALWATVSAAARGDETAAAAAAEEEAPYRSTLAAPALVERVRAAVAAGPYGNGSGGGVDAAEVARRHEQHFLATRGGGGGGA